MNEMTICRITNDALVLDAMVEEITTENTGAVGIFYGVVRGRTYFDKPVVTEFLEYETYKEMAEEKMGQVAREIRERWPSVESIVIVQRVGKLMPKTPTVLIACTAGHRNTGVFDATKYGIDRLKEIVPVWKKEVSLGGETWVEGKYIPKPNE